MGDFLTEVKTVTLRQKSQSSHTEKPLLEEIVPSKPLIQADRAAITSPEDALELLRSRPDIDALEDVLIYLSRRKDQNKFNIRVPSPASAKIINELISTTIPDFWDNLGGLRDLLLDNLRNVAGIGAVVARLRRLVSEFKPTKQGGVQPSDPTRPIMELVSVLSRLLNVDDLSQQVYTDMKKLIDNEAKQTLLWKEYLASVASGKVISAVAQAEATTNTTETLNERSWLSDGSKYSAWLGRNVVQLVRQGTSSSDDSIIKAAAQLCGKSFNVGYAARVVEEIHLELSLSDACPISSVERLIDNLQIHEQRQFLQLTMRFLGKHCLVLQQPSPEISENPSNTPDSILGSTALLRSLLSNQSMKDHLVSWLLDPATNSGEPFQIRRAAIASLASLERARSVLDEDPMQNVLESNWKLFGDQLFIRHTPASQQDACAQSLLMTAGYIQRTQPMFLFTLARSSLHLNAISNRLNASSQRARFLGMVVGMAISGLVDKQGSPLLFDVEETKTPEAMWFRELIKVNDRVGTIEEMRKILSTEKKHTTSPEATAPRKTQTKSVHKQKISPIVQTGIQGSRIMEILDDEDEDEEEDLVPYAKPDSDPEDDDEDATMVRRDKPKAPVYIRDLMAALRDTENYDRHSIALKAAASLIRRKSSFGKEVSDHAIELGLILISLGDTFNLEDFSELRLQALIATLLSNPAQLAPWFARQVFDGDYSLSQRATLLSVLGLGARELAGYKEEDDKLNPITQSTNFPSKQLPDRLHQIYAAGSSSINNGSNNKSIDDNNRTALIASNLEDSFIRPLAAKAADSMTGPNILKTRTFSSRMRVEASRTKPSSNALAKIVAEGFLLPLTGHWWQNVQAYGISSSSSAAAAAASASGNVHFQPWLLSTYLKTLAIILHASGPASGLSLAQVTAEVWSLVLGVRAAALGDVGILEAALFVLLTILEVNEESRGGMRRLAEEHGKELVETQGWVELVFEKAGVAGDDTEGRKIRMLAAGVLVKTRDVVDKYQRLLVGTMLDY